MSAIPQGAAPTSAATRALYERYYANIYRFALSELRSPQDAEDAAQNTFLRAFAALQRGVVPENESAWLFKIAHNVCLSSKLAWKRRRRVETPRDLDLLAVQPAARESRRDELDGLGAALATMPPRLREAFLLREWQGLSYEEIAQRLDTSRSAVESLIFRGRRHLAAALRPATSLGPLLNLLRGLFAGGSLAAKAVALVGLGAAGLVASGELAGRTTPRLIPTVGHAVQVPRGVPEPALPDPVPPPKAEATAPLAPTPTVVGPVQSRAAITTIRTATPTISVSVPPIAVTTISAPIATTPIPAPTIPALTTPVATTPAVTLPVPVPTLPKLP